MTFDESHRISVQFSFGAYQAPPSSSSAGGVRPRGTFVIVAVVIVQTLRLSLVERETARDSGGIISYRRRGSQISFARSLHPASFSGSDRVGPRSNIIPVRVARKCLRRPESAAAPESFCVIFRR
jgi:hypothetical protein